MSEEKPTLPKKPSPPSAIEVPEEFSKFYPSELEAKKIKKPLMCYLLDVDNDKKSRPTLVTKPIKVKYGAKWFNVHGQNGQRYFINYSQIMNFGKHYAYLCQYGNPVGALSFYEYPEDLTDSNQVEMMVNQHAVEVFKKHKGISPKLVLVIAIIACIAIIGMVLAINFAMGFNAQATNYQRQVTNLQNANQALIEENNNLKAQLGVLPQ